MSGKYHVRSISLPSRSHPTTQRLEEELNRLKTWGAMSTSTSESIHNGLAGLDDLYRCMDELLNMPLTQQVLSHHQNENFIEELLDGSVRLLDICGITRDFLLQIKEHVRVLQSAFRRRKGDSSCIESSINDYTCFRKKMKKDTRKLITALKKMENKWALSPVVDLDHHLSALIRVVREVCVMNASLFQSLLLFLTAPVPKPKPTGWSLVSKLIHRGVVACDEKQEEVNETGVVEAAVRYVSNEGIDAEKTEIAHKRLGDLEISIEDLESGLECVFRRLIKTRTSVLNILSQYSICLIL